MFIRVANGAPTVEDRQNLRQLHVELSGVDDSAAADAVENAGLGALDGDHAWLEIAALRAAGDGTGPWRDAFDDMITYARNEGWVEGTRVRAHVVRS